MGRLDRAAARHQARRDRMAGPTPAQQISLMIEAMRGRDQMASRRPNTSSSGMWSHNPFTGQYMTQMPFDLGSALGNAQARALPLQALNASSVPARAQAGANMYSSDAQVRMAQIQAQAMLEQQRLKNQTLTALLKMFSARMGGGLGGGSGFGGITTNYGAGVSPTPVTNYRGGA